MSESVPASSILSPVPSLDGDGFRLRALRAGDADALFALHSDPRVMRYWSQPPWIERRQADERIAQLASDRVRSGSFAWALTLADDDRLIGSASLFALNREHRRAEIGYALAPGHWGRGLATRMMQTVVDFAFGPLDLARLEADIDPRNEPSCRLVERLGFAREGLLRQRWRVGDEVTDSAIYGLLRGERA